VLVLFKIAELNTLPDISIRLTSAGSYRPLTVTLTFPLLGLGKMAKSNFAFDPLTVLVLE
jgi:hypothetical protein